MSYSSSASRFDRQQGIALQPLLLIVAGLLVVASLAAAGYFYFESGHSANQAAAKPVKTPPPPPIFVEIKPMTVNLQGGGQVLYIVLSLNVAHQSDADKLTAHMPQVRNRMLLALSDDSASTLTTAEGKRDVAKTLKKTLSAPYDDAGPVAVQNVLYTDFVVQ